LIGVICAARRTRRPARFILIRAVFPQAAIGKEIAHRAQLGFNARFAFGQPYRQYAGTTPERTGRDSSHVVYEEINSSAAPHSDFPDFTIQDNSIARRQNWRLNSEVLQVKADHH